MIGRTVVHYRVIEQLGAGGMGIVYRAEDLKLGRPVALKFLSPELTLDREAEARFEREARTASALNHPNICTIYAIDEVDGQRFIAMELLDGQPLSEVIGARPMPVGRILELAIQIGDALDAAHSQGILHRDIKPANIFVTRRGQAKVLDFGLAKLAPGTGTVTEAANGTMTMAGTLLSTRGMAVGTVAYMSPEQARGEELDVRSDLFSFGIVLYEMVTGQQAFGGRTSAIVFDGILNRMPPPVSLMSADIPPELERIIGKALEKDRGLRYQTASDLRADLQRLRRDRESGRAAAVSGTGPAVQASGMGLTPVPGTDEPISMRVPPSSGAPAPAPMRGTRHSKRTRVLAAVGAGLLILGAAGVAVGSRWLQRHEPTPAGATGAAEAANAGTAPAADSEGGDPLAAGTLEAVDPGAPQGQEVAAAPAVSAAAASSEGSRADGTERSAHRTAAAGANARRERAGAPPPAAPASEPAETAVVPALPPVSPVKPDPAVTLLDVARAKMEARLLDQAVADLQTITTSHAASRVAPGAHLLIGRIREQQGRPDDAMAAYVELRSRYAADEGSAEAALRLADLLLRTKRSDRVQAARDLLGDVPARHPESIWAPRALAAKAALEVRERIKEPDSALGGSVGAAIASYRTLADRYPHAPEVELALWQLGMAYDDLKRYDLAADAFSTLGTRFPRTRFDAWWRAAELYERRLRDRAAAQSAFAKVPERSPNFRDAQRRLR